MGHVKEAQSGILVAALFVAWALSEVIRYPWYAIALFREPPKLLTWLRYTMFIVLYPIGVASEIAIIYSSLPAIRNSKLLSIELPNSLNFSFSYYGFNLFGLLALYPTAFPWIYCTLWRQRARRLSMRPKAQ